MLSSGVGFTAPIGSKLAGGRVKIEEIWANIGKISTNPQENCGKQAFLIDFAAGKPHGIERRGSEEPA
jgi:hypothetical protein